MVGRTGGVWCLHFDDGLVTLSSLQSKQQLLLLDLHLLLLPVFAANVALHHKLLLQFAAFRTAVSVTAVYVAAMSVMAGAATAVSVTAVSVTAALML